MRWHRRPTIDAPGVELGILFNLCVGLTSVDLSRFYCWTEDVPTALAACSNLASRLVRLNLVNYCLSDGYRSTEVNIIVRGCANLEEFKILCVFNPNHFDFINDDCIVSIATNCPKLKILHLIEPESESDHHESQISTAALGNLFTGLPNLQDLAIDIKQYIRDARSAIEILANKCPKLKCLKFGMFQGICKAAGLHLDGVAICGGLEKLSIKSSDDLTDSSLLAIARGCNRLSTFEISKCDQVTEMGVKKMMSMLRSTIIDVKIFSCRNLDTRAVLRALMPVRDRIINLHIDCNWVIQDSVEEYENEEYGRLPKKKCRYSNEYTWDRLKKLSLWLPAGEVLSPIVDAGLDDCAQLEEISIKVEGDCRTCNRPSQPVFGLSCLANYPKLRKMKFDCGGAFGYAFTAPEGQMDLSLWERFYLHGIGELNELYELDYWPPQDREVNQRSLSLPATGLIQGCVGLRKLFIHGTTNEHFMRFFLKMPMLRDVQLREDYYPAPENDMSTEMRVDSCSRFEDALNSKEIPD